MGKHSKLSAVGASGAVRTRRAYFDCRFGQLHVRTAFPATGGFDEGVTLFCLHAREGTSKSFARLLPDIAAQRSVYAPDLPGFGESDPAPAVGHVEAAAAVTDLAVDLRLKQIDLLGVGFGATIALELAAMRPNLVRRLILLGAPPLDRIPAIQQPCLLVRSAADRPDQVRWAQGSLSNARVVDMAAADPLEAAPQDLVTRIAPFLQG